ncbi:MAG TPA: CDP-alcohol phosphatidyltransferase [Actinobacteria bacterium]|nr:CDP-alcohol phosphatidyltransferase [Actinomycetota bacterium]
MFDEKLRKIKDDILTAFTGGMASGINPEHITYCAFIAGTASAAAVIYGYLLPGLFLWILNRILDGLDGALARRYKKQTDKGAYLDIMADFAVYAMIPISFALKTNLKEIWIAAVFLLGSFYINTASWLYLSAILEKRRKEADNGILTSVVMPKGLVEGFETIIFYSLFFIFPSYLILLFSIMSVMTMISTMQRVYFSLKYL